MEPLRLGLVGVGGMGAEHLLMADEALPEARFTALCDVDRAALDRAAAGRDLPTFTDYHALIDSRACDAVLIATPHPFHAPVALYAAQRGLHLLSEKPLAVSVSAADAMIDAARAHGVLLAVMFQERALPAYRAAHSLLSANALGPLYRRVLLASHWFRSQLYFDSAAWRGTWRGEGGGIVMNQAAHSLDLLLWLGGQPSAVTAQTLTRGHAIEVEDTVSALLDYPDGSTGYLYTTTAQYPGEMRLEFSGEHGQLVVEEQRVRFFRLARPFSHSLRDEPPYHMPAGAWEDVPLDPAPAGHREVVRAFAAAVRQGAPLVADATAGLRSLELANALLLSGDQRRTVSLPLDRAAYDAFLERKRAAPHSRASC